MAIVSGEAGIGKSRLVSEVVERDGPLAWVRFPPTRLALPGFGLRQLADQGESAVLIKELGSEQLASGSWKLDAIFREADALLTANSPGILVLEDLQWSDELTLHWLSLTASMLQCSEVTIVGTVRTPDGPLPTRVALAMRELLRAGRLNILELRPLDLAATAQLALSAGNGNPEVAVQLHERSNGVPLAIEELLTLVTNKSASEATAALERAGARDLPVLSSIVLEELGELDSETLAVCEVTSLLPARASEGIARHVCSFGQRRFDSALEQAVASGLLSRTTIPGVLRFRHDLHREAVRDSMGLATRRKWHRRIAEALQNDPNFTAREVAEQLLEAGDFVDATAWLQAAADEAIRAHDPGGALQTLATALHVCPLDRSDLRTDLAERTVIPARSCDQPETAIELIDSVLSDISRPDQRGRLWLSRARLVSFHGDYTARIEALTLAMNEFTSAADDLGLARTLAELALPQGADPPMLERVALGQRSVELATACEDKSVLALCLGSLAAARISMGQPEAFDLWATASDVIESEVKDSSDEAAARNRANWSMAALAYGAYDQARRLLEPGSFVDGKDDSGDPFLHGVRVVYLWRRGRWDEALLEAEIAQNSVSLPQVASVACVVQTAISLERDRRPDLSELEHATLHLTDLVEEHWAPFAHSILMQARATRREPNPARGLISLCQMVIRSGVRIGWDDLLPSAADVDAKKCEQLLDSLGEQLPVGKRAEASLLLAKARIDLAFGRPTAKAQAEAAAAAFEALGEPYAMAKALEAWGHALKAAQRKPVDCWRRAAEVYVSLGADRSLASLIRRSRDSRVLDEYKIPRTQAHSRAVGLTRREKEVAELAAEAYTAGEIAAELGISVRTVQNHLQRIKAELGVRRKTQLVRTLRDA